MLSNQRVLSNQPIIFVRSYSFSTLASLICESQRSLNKSSEHFYSIPALQSRPNYRESACLKLTMDRKSRGAGVCAGQRVGRRLHARSLVPFELRKRLAIDQIGAFLSF